jgi:hypothetical protein
MLPQVLGIATGMETPNDSTNDMLDDLLDLKSSHIFPPLTDLPQGTDIGALARQIEGFAGLDDDAA